MSTERPPVLVDTVRPSGQDYLRYSLQDVITVGRNRKANVKVCDGPNVSRSHLKFIRWSESQSWHTTHHCTHCTLHTAHCT